MLNYLIIFAIPWIAYAYENIALHKSAWQLHPYMYNHNMITTNASNAVDGLKTNLSYFAGQCALSGDNRYEALWRVDLGAVLGIHHINIYYRTENAPWGPDNGFTTRFLGFSVYISNTTGKEDGVLCFKDDYFTKYTIPAVITLNCSHHGRYVIYYNNRTSSNLPPDYSHYAYKELCEFEVYGCPKPIYYGESCNLSCPTSCKNRRCHIETGKCFGCEDGYFGPTCNLQCDNGTFGTNCSNHCGHCYQGQSCDKETGACPKGCDSGYKGIPCNESCAHSFYGPNCRLRCSNTCINRTCDAEKGSCDMVQNEIADKKSKASAIIVESREILFEALTALLVVVFRRIVLN